MNQEPSDDYDPESDEELVPETPLDFRDRRFTDWSILDDMGVDGYE